MIPLENLQKIWVALYCKNNRYVLDCLLPLFVALGAAVIFNIPYLILDIVGCPKKLLKYKVQPAMNVPANRESVCNALKTVAFNNLVIGPIFVHFLFILRFFRGCYVGPNIPTFMDFTKQMFLIILVEEFAFYYGHKFFHSPVMYKKYHKKHHEWTAPISIVATYCHPLEHIVVNLGSVGLGPVVAKADTLTTVIWLIAAWFVTTCHHSGYEFPFLPSPKHHDYHHERFNQCYGTLGLLDYLHGTDTKFRRKQNREERRRISE